MTEKLKNTFAAITMLCVLFAGSAGMSYLLMEIEAGNYNTTALRNESQTAALDMTGTGANTEPQPPRQFAWEEQYELCALYALGCKAKPMEVEATVEEQLQPLSLSELANLYPLPEWNIREQEHIVTIQHNLAGLCSKHRSVYHLDGNETGQYLAVYYGPSAVGTAAGAFLVTDVLLSKLSPDQLAELHAGDYEYYSQEELIAVLDNFSEL